MSDLHKLTGAYAVDALDDLERARFEQHLAQCEDCRAEVAELRETAALLSETTAVSPPAALRESVLAGITQVRPLPPVVPEPVSRVPRRHPAWVPFLVAAALVLVAGIGVTAWRPWSSPQRQLSAADQVIQADDAQEFPVELDEGLGKATIIRSESQDRAVIVTEGMKAAPDGKDFELWFLPSPTEYVKAGLMPDGADQTIVLEGSAADAVAVGITVEPDGGSDQPTTEPIGVADLSEAA